MRLILPFLFVLVSLQSYAQGYEQSQKLAAPVRYENDFFGNALDGSGNKLIVGSPLHNYDTSEVNPVFDAGAAYVYLKDSSGIWNLNQKLCSNDRIIGGQFGGNVLVEGNEAFITSASKDYDSAAVHYFVADASGHYTNMQVIIPPVAVTKILACNIGYDGQTLAVPFLYDDTDEYGLDSMSSSGSVFLYEKDSTGLFVQVQKLCSPDRSSFDLFGEGLYMTSDFLFVGAAGEELDVMGTASLMNAGAVYAFKKDVGGTWVHHQKLVPHNRKEGMEFGYRIAANDSVLFISNGTPVSWDADTEFVYKFELSPTGQWIETDFMLSPEFDTTIMERFGSSLTLEEDKLIIGASYNRYDNYGNLSTPVGAMYVYGLDSVNNTNLIQKITLNDRVNVAGLGVNAYYDDGRIVAGAFADDLDADGLFPVTDAGAVYVFGNCIVPPGIIDHPEDISTCSSYAFKLDITTTAISPEINWWVDSGTGAELIEEGDSYFSNVHHSTIHMEHLPAGVYYFFCVVSNSCGTDISDTVTVVVKPSPVTTFIPAEDSLCTNSPVVNLSLYASPAGGSFSGMGVSGNSFSPMAVSGWVPVVYTYTGNNGCIVYDTAHFFVSTCNGITENEISAGINLFPNPASHHINIMVDQTLEGPFLLKLFDAAGKNIAEQEMFSQNHMMDLSGLSNGLFLVTVEDKKGKKFQQKLLVQP